MVPSNTLLPTPDPAKIPSRWPWPQVSNPGSVKSDHPTSGDVHKASAGGGRRCTGLAHRAHGQAVLRRRVRAADQFDRAPATDAVEIAQRHHESLLIAKTNDLGFDTLAGLPLDGNERPDRRRKIGDRGRKAYGLCDTAGETC